MISEKDAVNSITKFIVNRKQLLDQDLIPVAVSSRHLHISRADLDILFGNGYQLKPVKLLSQPEQFAAEEKVTVAGPRGEITNVRILGPERKEIRLLGDPVDVIPDRDLPHHLLEPGIGQVLG